MRRLGMGITKNIHSFVKIFASLSSSLRISRTLQYAAGMATRPKPARKLVKITKTELNNGIKVNVMNQDGKIGACTVMFQVGSRHETDSQLGVTHFLRAGSIMSSKCHSGFIKSRYLQAHGGYITVSTDRETVAFTLRCQRSDFSDLKRYLVDCSSRCSYADHELADIRKIIREDLERRPPEEHVLDLLQRACFIGPLSNSVYCEEERIDSVNSSAIRSFIPKLTPKLCSIGSCGFPMDQVMHLADNLILQSGGHCSTLMKSRPKSGYEFYDEGPVAITYMALGVPWTSYMEDHWFLLHALVAVSCGYASDHPWPNKHNVRDYTARLSIGEPTDDDPSTVCKPFNISYSDYGIFGMMVKTRSENAFHAGAQLAKFFKALHSLSPEHVFAGKRRLILGIHLNNTVCESASMGLAQMAFCALKDVDTSEFVSYIEKVKVDDVLQLAKSLAERCTKGAAGVAVVGDVEQAPDDVDFMQFLSDKNLKMKKFINSLTLPMTRTLVKSGKVKPPCLSRPDYGPPKVHVSDYMNGMRIAATQADGPIAAVTVLFQVGSIQEYDHLLGVTHFLRAGSVCDSQASSGYIRSRYLQQSGGYISVKTDRQTIAYTLRCPTPTFADIKCYLLDAGTRCEFFKHDLGHVRSMVREDLTRRKLPEHVIDLVQQACFRGPHTNSIYCEEDRINSMSSDSIIEYIGTYFKTNVCTIGACGVGCDEIQKLAAYIDCSRTAAPPIMCPLVSCARGGYEFYDYGPGGETYIAFAVPGSGMCDMCCYLQHAILAAACGLANTTQGSHVWDRTTQPPLGLLSEDDPFTDYTAFNIGYQTTGVFGIMVKTRGKQIRCAAFRAAEFLGKLQCLTCDQIELGKKRLQIGVHINNSYCESMSESLAYQLAYHLCCESAHLCNLIQSVPTECVMQLARNISSKRCSGQMAVAVVGDVEAAPDDCELRCF